MRKRSPRPGMGWDYDLLMALISAMGAGFAIQWDEPVFSIILLGCTITFLLLATSYLIWPKKQ